MELETTVKREITNETFSVLLKNVYAWMALALGSEIEYKKKYENGTFGSFEMMQNILNGEYFTWLFVFRHDILNDISFNEQFC